METAQWKAISLAHFEDTKFRRAAADFLQAIWEASEKDKPRKAAEFGGFMRRQRTMARLVLADALMTELGIVQTQHVANLVMTFTFGTAARTAVLDRFAEPGRDAGDKYTKPARASLARRPDLVLHFSQLYNWFCQELKNQIRKIRRATWAAWAASADAAQRPGRRQLSNRKRLKA